MHDAALSATTFLFSSQDPPTDGFFQGYCFIGNDFIFGQEGATAFHASTGREISGGLDGCYVIIRRRGSDVTFDIDHAGYKALFYYWDDDLWVVSNSFAQTVDYLRASGRPITPNYAHLAPILTPGSASSQLFSFETVARGVKLAPRATTLVVSPGGITMPRRETGARLDYETGLQRHLDTWVGRFETLMADPKADISIDLTGGVDSRTNFALLTTALSRLGDTATPPQLNCGSTSTNTADLDVATLICKEFGLELNDKRKFDRFKLSADESLQLFHALNAGVSYTTYIPVEGPSPYAISIGGGGGEIHRRFYENHLRSKDPETFVTRQAERLDIRWLAAEYARDGRAALETADIPGTDPLRLHYREFRHRFHVGRSPRYRTAFTPLDSTTADAAQSMAGPERLDEGQFNYDVIASLSPDLLDLPFDNPSKAPSPSVRDRLTRVTIPAEPNPGRVWAVPTPRRQVKNSTLERAQLVRSAIDRAVESPFVRAFWGEAVIDRAYQLTDSMLDGSGIGNAVNGKPISALLAAELVDPGRSLSS